LFHKGIEARNLGCAKGRAQLRYGGVPRGVHLLPDLLHRLRRGGQFRGPADPAGTRLRAQLSAGIEKVQVGQVTDR
jgi:hypothetical protein